MNAMTIGVSALAAGQRGLTLTGQNITNATTPGYRRQGVSLGSRESGGQPTGVDVLRITRFDAPPLRAAILRGNSEAASATASLDVQRQVEISLGQAPNDLGSKTDNLFNTLDRLASRPADTAARREAIATAGQLAGQFNNISREISQIQNNVGQQVVLQVNEVNTITSRIADLNGRIYKTEVMGETANELRDQRDKLIDDLSQRIDFQTVELPYGVTNLIANNSAIVVSDTPVKFSAQINSSNQIQIFAEGQPDPVRFTSGSVGGLVKEYNLGLTETQSRLDDLARTLAARLDQAQATGLGTAGPLTSVVGTRGVDDPTLPLATQNLPIPIQNGQLTISLTNSATGVRTNANIAIDPATQSLNDIAAAITAGTGGQITATVDTPTNVLRFQAQPGVAFDFAGRVPTSPPTNTLAGTSTPTLDGAFNGTANENFTFNVVGSGTVGTTPGLQLEVRDAANNLVRTLDVGEGYSPDTALAVGNGLSVKLSAGTLTGGSFATPANGTPDTAGVLAGLGVGGLFAGSSASTLRVRPELTVNSGLLATSRNGQPGDTSNLQRLAGLRTTAIFPGSRTISQEAVDIASAVGTKIRQYDDQQTSQTNIVQNLFAQEQSIAGVDVNEEVVKLLDFQRMIEVASRYINVVNEAMDAIVQTVR